MHKTSLPRRSGALSFPAFAALLACAAPVAQAASVAGTVAFTRGEVSIRNAQGTSRSAASGSPVETGETIDTGTGRAQLRMVDGAYISLQPDTVLTFDNYQVRTATAPEAGFMSLVRGGMRTITGLIGRTDRANYRVTTPTATLGIRGTEYSLTVTDPESQTPTPTPPPAGSTTEAPAVKAKPPSGASNAPTQGNPKSAGTVVKVVQGITNVCSTDGTCIIILAGESGFVPPAGLGNVPTKTKSAPSLPPEPESTPTDQGTKKASKQESQGPTFVAAETRDEEGASGTLVTAIPKPVPKPISGPGTIGIAYATFGDVPFGATMRTAAELRYDGNGALYEYIDTSPLWRAGGTVADSGYDGVIAWGRWTSGSAYFAGFSSTLQTLHYYATSSTQTSAIPVVQAYAAFASTAPTLTNASSGALLTTGVANSVTGSININFTGASGGTATYALSVPIAGEVFNLSGVAAQYNTTGFRGAGAIGSVGSGCSSGCYGAMTGYNAIQGEVTGTGNSRVGANYGFTSQQLGEAFGAIYGGVVSGAVVFK